MLYYAKSTGGFYDSVIHTPQQIPSDAVEITVGQYQALLAGQEQGQVITSDSNGNPINAPQPAPTQAETIAIISSAIQNSLDAGAQKWNYQDLATAASYANSTIPQYAADAKALIAWRDAVWSWAIPQFATIVAGTDPQTFMANMPVQPTQPKV
ncbi:hypothetical protein [Caudoviricetes sp.]|nr:hypothetical protein [Caudoviricetes sp.]